MTVANTNPIQHYTANGSETFVFGFAVEGKDNLKVTVEDTVVSINDYSYDASLNAVVFNTAPTAGLEVVVERVTSLDRSINYQTHDNSFRPETLNYDLDRIWRVLQEKKIEDVAILAKIVDEIEWRRTHDINYDALAQARELQLFESLKGYIDTITVAANPNIFEGVGAGIVFALDKKTVQTHLDIIYSMFAEYRTKLDENKVAINTETQRANEAENSLNNKFNAYYTKSETYLKSEVYNKNEVDFQLSAISNGLVASFNTYVEAQEATHTLPSNSSIKVTNDPDTTLNGEYTWNGTALTKSIYDPLTQALAYTNLSLSSVYKENLYNSANSHAGKNIDPANGAIRSSTTVEINVFSIEGGKTYSIKTDTVINKSYVVVGVSTTNSTIAGTATQLITLEDTEDPLVKEFTTPFGSKYAYINTYWNTVSVDLRSSLVISSNNFEKVVKNIQGNRVFDEEAHTKIDGLVSDALLESDLVMNVADLYSVNNEYPGFYVNRIGSSVSSYNTSSLNMFPIEQGKTYYIRANSFLTNACVGLKTDTNVTSGTALFILLLQDHAVGVKKFTVPNDTPYTHALFTTHLSSQNYSIVDSISIQESENQAYLVSIKGAKINSNIPANLENRLNTIENQLSTIDSVSPLTGLKWAVIGDSITEKNFRTNKNYHDYVAEAVGGMTVLNYGQSGNGWNHRANVPQTITSNPDIITVFLGTNDFGIAAREFGEFKDGAGTTTVCGSIELLLTNLVNSFPTKRLGILLPLPRYNSYGIDGGTPNSFGYTLRQVSEMIVKYANHFGIPYLDLYNASGLAVYNSISNSYYFTYPGATAPDGVHPNDLGHQLIARKIKKFLEEIV